MHSTSISQEVPMYSGDELYDDDVTSGPAAYVAPDPATEDDDEPEVELGQELADAIDTTLEAMAELVVALNRADGGIGLFRHFRAYHMASLEGNDGGWLGGPHLVDALRSLRQGEF